MTTLTKRLNSPNAKYLVFTSAGENSNLHHWLKGKCFDLWVCYYGNSGQKYAESADYYVSRKGGKFPNLHYCYQQWKDIISQYDAIFIMDDDLIISGHDIDKCFKAREESDLWLLQPAFDRRGKISFKVTELQPFSYLRYVNFVEVTCPLFVREKFEKFMKEYDPILVGWGVDIWYSQILSLHDLSNRKIAILDEVDCINPRDSSKPNNAREIDKLQSSERRIEIWSEIVEKYQLSPVLEKKEYGAIGNRMTCVSLLRDVRIIMTKTVYSLYKTIRRERWRPT